MYSLISSYGRRTVNGFLMVLSASLMFAQTSPTPVIDTLIEGAMYVRASGTVEQGVLRANSNGNGTASRLGPFTYTEKANVDLATGLSSGTCQLVTINGDVINASFAGRTLPDNVPSGSHLISLLTITGGTGRFRGATGGVTMHRYFDDSGIPVFNLGYGTLSGTISVPLATK